ncbi:MAG: AAA family ATPase [Candidatus Rokubacteria bacterium]|nr:AAA family ATPase [Candidatus Rokubacteria bacterium]
MRCSHCSFEVAADFNFCPKCGRQLSRQCPNCAYVCPPEFRYCPRCGTEVSTGVAARAQPPVSAARPPAQAELTRSESVEAERRPVTLLFADVVGFTSLADKLDPEELRSLMMGCFQTLAEEIRRYDGFIEKFIGDAIVAIFGAPTAHEDDPERAVRAALSMQRQLGQLRAGADDVTGGALTMRIGINTGLVVAGAVGEGKDYGVVGDAVNVAARLQQVGAPGKITVSEETYRLIRRAFDCRPLGPVALKGKAEPVQAFEVVGAASGRAPTLDSEARVPLVGREEELGQLLELLSRARKGRTQVVNVVGEAGIGKSRLLAEFLRRLDADGVLSSIVLYQTACPAVGSEAYRVFIDFFRACFGLRPEESAAEARAKITGTLQAMGAAVERVIPVVEHFLGVRDEALHTEQLDPEQLKRQLGLAVREICDCQARLRPVLLVVEDFQWADAASVELLASLADRAPDRPLMVLLVARSTPQAGTIYSARVDSTVIRLHPLTLEESQALVGRLVGPLAPQSQPLFDELVTQRAAGNPFFLGEAARSLMDRGVLVSTPGGLRLAADVTSLEVPSTVQGILLSRLDRLEPAAKQLLLEAAVLGPRFDAEVLSRIASQPQELHDRLDALVSADLLAEAPDAGGRSEYRFRNSLIQEVAYASLLRRRRSALHELTARTLEQLHAQHLDEYLSELAHHYSLSDNRERALEYLLRFGDHAVRIYANRDAVRAYRRALELVEAQRDHSVLRAKVLEKLADATQALGEPEVALQHWEAALAHYAALDNKNSMASVQRKIGLAWWNRGDREKALECFERGLDLLAQAPEGIEAALLYHELGRLHFRIGDDERASHWARRALDLGERLRAHEVVSQAFNTVGVSIARRGALEEGIANVEQSLQTALQHELLAAACRAYANLGMLLAAVDRERAVRYCEEGLALAKKIGDLFQQSWLYTSMASSYCSFTGDCAQGIEAARASIALDQQLGQRNHLPIPLVLLGQIHQCQNQFEESERYYLEAVAIAEEIGEPQLLFPCYDGLATLYLAMGETAKAEAYLAQGHELCEKTGYAPDALIMLPFLS